MTKGKEHWIPLTAAVGGIAALALRTWNLRTAFEPLTGLPVSGHPSFPLLLLLFAACMAAMLRLPTGGTLRFPFRAQRSTACSLPVAGAMLLGLSGLADIYESFTGVNLMYFLQGEPSQRYESSTGLIAGDAVGMSAGLQCFSGLLTLCAAWAVFECIRACLHEPLKFRAVVLVPAVSMSFRLVAMYRIDSVNPVLQDYAPGLLAMVFQVFGFYVFSAFAFERGNLRQYAVSAGGAVMLTICVLLDPVDYISTPLMTCGGAAVLMGFYMLATTAPGTV